MCVVGLVLAPPTGCGFCLEIFSPGTQNTKNAYPGLISSHAYGVASPKGCRELSPGWSVFCDTRGRVQCWQIAPRTGVRGLTPLVSFLRRERARVCYDSIKETLPEAIHENHCTSIRSHS